MASPGGAGPSGPRTQGFKAAGADVSAEKGLETSPTGARGGPRASRRKFYPLAPNQLGGGSAEKDE